MDLNEKLRNFDPNALGDTNNNIYGLPFSPEEASLVIIPVPWEVTVSYSPGTADAPEAIFEASFQVDLYDPVVKDAWRLGIAMDEIDEQIREKSDALREKAASYLERYAAGDNPDHDPTLLSIRAEVNTGSEELNRRVRDKALSYLEQGKMAAVLGGDHSTPLGLIQALAEKHDSFGILQIDAHADLREAYEGFEFSHASIMYNALKIRELSKLVQVGIRDYCEAELRIIGTDSRIQTFFDRDMKYRMYEGKSWSDITEEIIWHLPEKVYLSIDIDGLNPALCPNTGTPVPGGLEYDQLIYLVERLVGSGRQIIGFDLNEVAPGEDEWDANVGARVLYRVANLALLSHEEKD
jgi:agmatinase